MTGSRWRIAGRRTAGSAFDLGKIRDFPRRLADLVEQLEAILAPVRHLDVDGDLVEERVDLRAQRRDGMHRGPEVLTRDRLGRGLPGDVDAGGELALLALEIEMRVGRAGVAHAVLLLLDANDVGRALVTGEQVLAVVTV